MKKYKWQKIAAIVAMLLSTGAGINIYTGQNNDVSPIHEQIREITHSDKIIIEFGKTYHLEDGYKIEITIDKFNRKRVIFTPGENNVR